MPAVPQKRLSNRARQILLLLLVVLPLALFCALVLAVAAQDRRLTDWAPEVVAEHSRIGLLNVLYLKNPPEMSKLPVVEVLMANGAPEAMASALVHGDPALDHDPGGDKPYFECFYIDESGRSQRGEVCLRGLNDWHHRLRKPSLRVKLKKSEVELGRRYVELSRPEDPLALSNLLAEEIAREFGVMAQVEDHVAFYLNNRFCGVYLRGHRVGDSLALANKRIPGTFFKGDLPGGFELWEGLSLWAVEGQDSPVAREAMTRLLELRSLPASWQRLDQVAQVLEADAMARWAALNIVTGTAHTDNCHNQVFFYNPARGKLEPVVWDPNSFGVDLPPEAPVDVYPSPVEEIFASDPLWVHQRNLYIADLLGSLCSEASLKGRIDKLLAASLPWLEADPDLGRLVRTEEFFRLKPYAVTDLPLASRELSDWIARRHRLLTDYLAEARFSLQPGPGEGSTVKVFGRIAIRARGPGGEDRLLYPGLARRRVRPSEDAPVNLTIFPAATLEYELPWPPGSITFVNAVTGTPIQPETEPAGPPVELVSLRPRSESSPRPETVRLGPGRVTLQESLILGSEATLEIAAGTEILLAPGVSILSKGRVLALGSSEAPIRLRALKADQPWGALGLQGEATAGSRLEHTRVEGGSTARRDYLVFKAMLSVHGCPDLRLSDCHVKASRSGQDAGSLVESQVRIERSSWSDGNDGLDTDACVGTVQDCLFESNSDDGLESSGSNLMVERCRFITYGSSGLVAGAGSRLRVEG